MKKVIYTLQVIAFVCGLVSITGCGRTIGKGPRIMAETDTVKPYPVINATTESTTESTTTSATTITTVCISSEEVLTSETTTTTMMDIVAEPLSLTTDMNNEEDVEVDVTEASSETYDDGYFPSVQNGFITEEERIFLCNTVGSEYGSDWISIYDKAMVVDTVMTRVYQGGWTNGLDSTVYNVLTAPYQYNPWYAESYYHDCVTQSCIDAVEYYFQHQDEFPHYTSFYGDGEVNHFYN